MMLGKISTACFLLATACRAQDIAVSGVVVDSATRKAVGGAVVLLESAGLSDTTDEEGRFELTDKSTHARFENDAKRAPNAAVRIHNRSVFVHAEGPTHVKITGYGIRGRAVLRIDKTFRRGNHRVSLSPASSGLYIYRVMPNGEEHFLRGLWTDGVVSAIPSGNRGAPPRTLAKRGTCASTMDDVIKVMKEGYLFRRVEMTEDDTTGIEIELVNQDAGTVEDIDGNEYHAIRIGEQVWTVENLRTTRYNDDTAIPHETDTTIWTELSTPAYCFYDNTTDPSEQEKWGALYNWYAVNTGKLAPEGWHVASDSDWTVLAEYLIANGYNYDGTTSENKIGKSLAAGTDWNANAGDPGAVGNDFTSNNTSGFSALPAGRRDWRGGRFSGRGSGGYWWTSTKRAEALSYIRFLGYYGSKLNTYDHNEKCGLSIRLVKD